MLSVIVAIKVYCRSKLLEQKLYKSLDGDALIFVTMI